MMREIGVVRPVEKHVDHTRYVPTTDPAALQAYTFGSPPPGPNAVPGAVPGPPGPGPPRAAPAPATPQPTAAPQQWPPAFPFPNVLAPQLAQHAPGMFGHVPQPPSAAPLPGYFGQPAFPGPGGAGATDLFPPGVPHAAASFGTSVGPGASAAAPPGPGGAAFGQSYPSAAFGAYPQSPSPSPLQEHR